MKCMPPAFPHTIGIAGHIDHGKTTLTRCLTGVNTDRLKEEKERGISIELGFASCVLPGGTVIGVVDVPGHERFIRQMIAGAAGIDLALLVVAADEGIMPQTQEHADILQLLGIDRVIVVLTKIDAVDMEWLGMVRETVEEWARETVYANSPVVAVSAKTGEGIELLKQTMERELAKLPVRMDRSPARLPIDRVFKITGAGTVVTGTLYEGTITEGDVLDLLPAGGRVRVRQLHVHNRRVDAAYAGQRVALNITGEGTDAAKRGKTLTAPGSFQGTDRIDVRFFMLKSCEIALKQRTRVRLHIGTSEVIGKIVFFDRNVMEPGEEAVCQLLLEEPIVARRGDPFVIRRLSPMSTIGGGRVINPYTERHRYGADTVAKLMRVAQGDLGEQIVHYLGEEGFSTVGQVMQHLSLGKEDVQAVLSRAGDQVITFRRGSGTESESDHLVLSSTLAKWVQRMVDELAAYHQMHPMRLGMDKASVKSLHFHRLPDKLWRDLVEYARESGKIAEQQHFLHLTGFRPHIPDRYRQKAEQAVDTLRKSGWTPPPWEDVVRQCGIPNDIADDLKAYLLIQGELVHLAEELYIHRTEWVKGVEKLREHSIRLKILTPAAAKEILGLSRKYLIPFLESLDRERLTRRVEEGRVWQE